MSTSRKLSLVPKGEVKGRDRAIRVSVDRNTSLNRVKGRVMPWGALSDLLRKARYSTEITQKQYEAMNADEKQKEKMRAGYVFGGECADGVRRNGNVQNRSIVNLDIDNMTADEFAMFRAGVGLPGEFDLNEYEYVWYTTRSHTPEHPKFRVIVPLHDAIEPEKYEAVARITASYLDPTMEHIDTVSFVLAQMMYLPLTNKGGEFLSGYNTGKFLDADAVLDAFGDWKDFSKLPAKEDEDLSSHRGPGAKAGNPYEKPGLIGAFNRAYSIPEAIEEFLDDTYAEVTSTDRVPRYTFLKSSTGQTGGARYFPKDGMIFSHHTSDPIGDGHGYSAFDMVRMHLYGHLDDKKSENPTKAKSYKAMEDRFAEDPRVKDEMVQESLDMDALIDEAYHGTEKKDELDDEDDEDEEDDGLGEESAEAKLKRWLRGLDTDQNGNIKPTLSNAFAVMTNDPRVNGVIGFNEFKGRPVKLRSFLKTSFKQDMFDLPVIDDENGEAWTDADDAMMRLFLSNPRGKGSSFYGLQVSSAVYENAIRLAAVRHRFHPVKRYFEGLKWDGKKRIERLYIDYLGVKDNKYHRRTALLAMIAAVDRVYVPGGKWDHVPILEGGSGKQKSTFIRTLACGWFAELRGHDFSDARKMAELFEGALIVEIPELQGFNRQEAEALKSFFSSSQDKARAAFDRRVSENRRQVTFMGSTNERIYLKDAEGNRRYWPIVVLIDRIDIEKLRRELDQLWAEAKHLRDEMRAEKPTGDLPLYLEWGSEEEAFALKLQGEKSIDSAERQNAGTLERWLDEPANVWEANCIDEDQAKHTNIDELEVQRDRTCVKEIMAKCNEFEGKAYDRRVAQEIGAAMARIKTWKAMPMRRTPGYGPQRIYVRIGGKFDEE